MRIYLVSLLDTLPNALLRSRHYLISGSPMWPCSGEASAAQLWRSPVWGLGVSPNLTSALRKSWEAAYLHCTWGLVTVLCQKLVRKFRICDKFSFPLNPNFQKKAQFCPQHWLRGLGPVVVHSLMGYTCSPSTEEAEVGGESGAALATWDHLKKQTNKNQCPKDRG